MKVTYTTSDGKPFDNRADAKKHESALKAEEKKREALGGLVNFLTARGLAPEAIEEIVAAIQADPGAFREALRKTRKPRADAGVPRKAGARAA